MKVIAELRVRVFKILVRVHVSVVVVMVNMVKGRDISVASCVHSCARHMRLGEPIMVCMVCRGCLIAQSVVLGL